MELKKVISFKVVKYLKRRRATKVLLLCLLFAAVIGMTLAPAIVTAQKSFDFGDAPEGALAYPSSGVTGAFPTCTGGTAGYVIHSNFGAVFGPTVDYEVDGNAGNCPLFNPNSYDQDECFNDGDAGLIMPEPYTIRGAVGSEVVAPCAGCNGTALGNVCQQAKWGTDIDIQVHNAMPGGTDGYVNVLVDWNQDGQWGGSSTCPGGAVVNEHVLHNLLVPNRYHGPLSALGPADFNIGPNPGYVWVRFTISPPMPLVPWDWDGAKGFEDGESEDYLLRVDGGGPVGGTALPIERAELLLPWLGVAALVAGAIVVVLKKRLT